MPENSPRTFPDRVACVGNPERVCPARLLIDTLYSDSVPAVVDDQLPSFAHSSLDGVKGTLKLTEHAMQATVRGCTGPEAEACPTRTAMDVSVPRTTVVTWIRKILR